MDKADILNNILGNIDRILFEMLIDEFISMERRYVLGDWEPATLDGGQFAEIASRIIYHLDSGNLNRRKSVDNCLNYIEDEQNNNPHSFGSRRTALHLCKVIRTIYKFRSQRGAVHIDPDYTANEIDSAMIMGNVRWLISDLLRIFWTGDSDNVVKIIKEIVRYEVPAILKIDNRYLLLRTDCTVKEELLILLHNSGERGLSRNEIGNSVPKSAPSITNALRKLISPQVREVVLNNDKRYSLTPIGVRRVKTELSAKLSLS